MKWPCTHLEVDATIILVGTWAALGTLYWAFYGLRGATKDSASQTSKQEERIEQLERRVAELESDSAVEAVKKVQRMIEGKGFDSTPPKI